MNATISTCANGFPAHYLEPVPKGKYFSLSSLAPSHRQARLVRVELSRVGQRCYALRFLRYYSGKNALDNQLNYQSLQRYQRLRVEHWIEQLYDLAAIYTRILMRLA
jgi:hypothetical protein